jgi:hypothetical protein
MIRSTALLTFLPVFALASAAPPPTPPGDDIYSPGRALVADIDRIVTPNGVDETYSGQRARRRSRSAPRGGHSGSTIPKPPIAKHGTTAAPSP